MPYFIGASVVLLRVGGDGGLRQGIPSNQFRERERRQTEKSRSFEKLMKSSGRRKRMMEKMKPKKRETQDEGAPGKTGSGGTRCQLLPLTTFFNRSTFSRAADDGPLRSIQRLDKMVETGRKRGRN